MKLNTHTHTLTHRVPRPKTHNSNNILYHAFFDLERVENESGFRQFNSCVSGRTYDRKKKSLGNYASPGTGSKINFLRFTNVRVCVYVYVCVYMYLRVCRYKNVRVCI